jgi:hypothetical protein
LNKTDFEEVIRYAEFRKARAAMENNKHTPLRVQKKKVLPDEP